MILKPEERRELVNHRMSRALSELKKKRHYCSKIICMRRLLAEFITACFMHCRRLRFSTISKAANIAVSSVGLISVKYNNDLLKNLRIKPLFGGNRFERIQYFGTGDFPTLVKGWACYYRLEAEPALLKFALDVGLGARNS